MATWKYKKEFTVAEYFGDENYTLDIQWNTTSDTGWIMEDGKAKYYFGLEKLDALLELLNKIKKDHG